MSGGHLQGENMKDFKNYIIGFLTATCMFLFMGQTSPDKTITIEQVYDVVNTISIDVKEIKKNQEEGLSKLNFFNK
jgi:hypothetical protein